MLVSFRPLPSLFWHFGARRVLIMAHRASWCVSQHPCSWPIGHLIVFMRDGRSGRSLPALRRPLFILSGTLVPAMGNLAQRTICQSIWHSGACHGQSSPEDNLSINLHASRWFSLFAVYLRLSLFCSFILLQMHEPVLLDGHLLCLSFCLWLFVSLSLCLFVSLSLCLSLSLYICFYLCLCLCLCLYQALDLFLYLSPVTHSFLFSSMWLVRNNVEKNVDVHLVLSEVLLTLTWSDSRHDNVVT